MSKVPIHGYYGTTWIETDEKPLAPSEAAEFDQFCENLDREFILYYQSRLTALGHPNTYEDAKRVYEDSELSRKVDYEYNRLERTNFIAEVVGELEQFQRKLKG